MKITGVCAALALAALLACHQSQTGSEESEADTSPGPLALGTELPAIRGVTLDGSIVSNESLHGKTVLLNLWFFR